MREDDTFYLRYIIEDAHHIKLNLPSFEEFMNNLILRMALLKFAENIGEGSKNISEAVRTETSSMFPWREWIRFRDRNVHGYFSVDYDIVWKALQDIVTKVTDLELLREGLLKDK